MHPEEIKIALKDVGSSMAEISRRAGTSKSNVLYVVHGANQNERIRRLIARQIGRSVADIWPEAKQEEKNAA